MEDQEKIDVDAMARAHGFKDFADAVRVQNELRERVQKWKEEEKDRKARVRKAHVLARQILKRTEEIKAMRKLLTDIFYFDGHNRAFNYADRAVFNAETEDIRKALSIEVEAH